MCERERIDGGLAQKATQIIKYELSSCAAIITVNYKLDLIEFGFKKNSADWTQAADPDQRGFRQHKPFIFLLINTLFSYNL